MRSLFIYDPHDLDASVPGGVQICTRELLAVVTEASSAVELFPVRVSRNLIRRVRRRLRLGSYLFYDPSEYRLSLANSLDSFSPTHVFLNRCELLRLAPLVRKLRPAVKIVVLSHGNQSGDDLYEVAGPCGSKSAGVSKLVATWQLGYDLMTESRFRHQWIDAVCVISEEEAILERWLGTGLTFVIPRLIQTDPVVWQPVSRRAGFVGTLNHTPNRIALERVLDQLSSLDIVKPEIRLVGGPESYGNDLAARYSFVQYLGRLNDSDLRDEVASWSLFLNPIFWLSRGSSMKLGQAMSWGLPLLSTRSGVRGYQFLPGQVAITADSVSVFVSELISLLDDKARLLQLRNQLLHSGKLGPSIEKLGCELRSSLRLC